MKTTVPYPPAMKKRAMLKKPLFQKKRRTIRQRKGAGTYQKRLREDEDDDLVR